MRAQDRPSLVAAACAVTFPHPPDDTRAAIERLTARDQDLAGILQRAGPLPWRSRAPGFLGLLQAIVAQQISNQAAFAIWHRLHATLGALQPDTMLALPHEALRAASLSRPKILHARALATAFLDGTLSPVHIAALDDEAAIAVIAAVRGLGRWTAEIYRCSRSAGTTCFPSVTSRSPLRWWISMASRRGPIRSRCVPLPRPGGRPVRWPRGCCGITGAILPAGQCDDLPLV